MTDQCLAWPAGGSTITGNHTLWLAAVPGYWRPHFYDDRFYACPGENCLGGYYSNCVEGTTGPVCAVCERSFGKQGTACLKCPDDAINTVVLIAIAIATLIVILIMVNSNLSSEARPKSVFSIVIKILLNHLQTATLMQDFQAKITGIVKDLFDIQSQATPDTNFTSFSCLTGWNMYAIFLMWMLVPVFVLGVPGFVAAVAAVLQRRALRQKQKRLTAELERRKMLDLQTHDIEIHLEALVTRALPEEIFVLDADDDEISIIESENEHMTFDEIVRDERARNEKLRKAEEERERRVEEKAVQLFGQLPEGQSVSFSKELTSKSTTPRMSRRQSMTSEKRKKLDAALTKYIKFDQSGKPVVDGLENCSVCCADFAIYRCEECPDSPLFCEQCWNVVHAPEGERAAHDRLMYQVQNADKREYNQKYAKLYAEVMQTKAKVPALEIWIVTVLVVIFLIYPSLMTQIAMMMKCVRIDSIGKSYLSADYTIECGTPEYKRWAFVARMFFFLYGIGIPLAGTILLTVKRKLLLEKATMATYGFLYSGYRLQFFFWEFVIMLRKMLVVFIIVFYEGDSNYSIMFGMWLVLAFLILNIMVQPFQLRLYWRLENISLAAVTITLNAAMLYQPRFNLDATGEALVTLFIFLVNVLVLAMFAYYIVVAAKLQLLRHFDLDGSGDVTWREFVLVIKRWLHENHGTTLRHWGFSIENPAEEIERLRQVRKEQKLQAAKDNWKRAAARERAARRLTANAEGEASVNKPASPAQASPKQVVLDEQEAGSRSNRNTPPPPPPVLPSQPHNDEAEAAAATPS